MRHDSCRVRHLDLPCRRSLELHQRYPYGVSSLSGDDRLRGGLVARVRPPASPAKIFILRGKARAAPSPPQRQSAAPWLGCACSRTTPADSRCPPRPRLFATTAGPMADAIALLR